jgi:hypothetical protein
MLVGRDIPVPDDVFVSDLMDGEFPLRVEAARLLCAGESPVWTSRIFMGMPLQTDPLSLLLFCALPPALALGWLIGWLLCVAAGGTYLLARQMGASRLGAVLAGFAFAWSGFMVCHLRHLGVLGTVAYFPLALFCLERAATGGLPTRTAAWALPFRYRFRWLLGFAVVFGCQCLAGFPQSVYISALVYGALVLFRACWLVAAAEEVVPWGGRWRPACVLASGAVLALGIGLLLGMAVLLPLYQLGTVSDRSSGGTYAWATFFNYWPRDVLSFIRPYWNGDISNLTYRGTGIFWEDYGYLGLATLLLALLAVVSRVRHFVVAFWTLTAVVAFGLVLGREAPFYRLAFDHVPGLATFRFPTRFLFVVELALALLGGVGFTVLGGWWDRWRRARGVAGPGWLLPALMVAGTMAELVYANRRQNPWVDAREWLAQPRAAAIIRAAGEEGRVFSPGSRQRHVAMFLQARGWGGDRQLFLQQREFLQPNANLLYGLATLDGYTGIAPRWLVDLIGDHNRIGLVGMMFAVGTNDFRVAPAFFDWLEALSVRWVILPLAGGTERLAYAGSAPPAEVYRLPGSLPRARVVTRARLVAGPAEAWRKLVFSGAVDPRREVWLHDPAAASVVAALTKLPLEAAAASTARLVTDRSTEVVVDATAPHGGLLLLADTFYPGWQATVDGQPVEILRANVAQRAVALPPGTHRVVFVFRAPGLQMGLLLTAGGVLLLAVGAWMLRDVRCAPRLTTGSSALP